MTLRAAKENRASDIELNQMFDGKKRLSLASRGASTYKSCTQRALRPSLADVGVDRSDPQQKTTNSCMHARIKGYQCLQWSINPDPSPGKGHALFRDWLLVNYEGAGRSESHTLCSFLCARIFVLWLLFSSGQVSQIYSRRRGRMMTWTPRRRRRRRQRRRRRRRSREEGSKAPMVMRRRGRSMMMKIRSVRAQVRFCGYF